MNPRMQLINASSVSRFFLGNEIFPRRLNDTGTHDYFKFCRLECILWLNYFSVIYLVYFMTHYSVSVHCKCEMVKFE